ncbi:MupA/Atu3671 family FMN-dependent luciferase-like monooxygenase [Cribrihabitans neustonicus]|uniref:MupA/Atu3671 family FMN-dependent luciferase-like monooxygenase n=1 Tax=Cribrihabitans neustonicus TaxID=1429085 RepID=UPI003B5BFD57
MTRFSSVLIGNESLLIACAEALLARGHGVRAVVSQDAAIRDWAAAKDLALLAQAAEIPAGFDWLLSIANLAVLPDEVLARAGRGAVNFHDGPLPRYAGLNTPNWALIEGAREYGITWHLIEGGVDEGGILASRQFEVAEDETALSLNSKCYAAAAESFGAVLDQLESGALERQPQDLSKRRCYRKTLRPAAGGMLDFSRPAAELARLVRALDFGGYWNPLCAAKLRIGGDVVLTGTARAVEGHGAPGTILAVERDTLTVAAADGALSLSRLTTPAGLPVVAEALCKAGDRVPVLEQAEAEEITARLAAAQRGEGYWRKALAAMQPAQVPLSAATGETGFASRTIVLPAGLGPAHTIAGVLAWALLGSGAEAADVALAAEGMEALPGLVSGWVPLQARRGDGVAGLVARAAEGLEKARAYGGFAEDLVARAPEITALKMPEIGLRLEQNTPLAGCAATLCLTGEALTLVTDKARLSEFAAGLLAHRLELLLAALADNPDQPVAALPLLPEGERHLLLETWNDTATEYAEDLTIHAAFEARAREAPDAVALVFEDRSFTCAEVDARANAVAQRLQEMGIGRGTRVGLCLRRSPEMVFAALGILKAGGAYVPMDPAYPAQRLAHFLGDSGAQVVVTSAALAAGLPPSDAAVLEVESLAFDAPAQPEDSGAGGQDLAYVIYTSGSTGQPKGVMVRHANVANFFAGMDARIPHGEGDAWLAVTSLSFDISVLELFWTLTRGLRLVLSSDESRLELSNGPIALSGRGMDFNLFYWGNDDGPGPQKYHLLLEGAKFADANGFNAVWTPERHFHAFGGPYPNPAVTGAAVAAVTQNIGVRAGSCVAPLHHAARIAEEWAVIDNLTAGRAGIGFASGWQPDDFILRPENTPPANKPALFEAVETVRRLWRGEEVAFPRQDGSTHAVITQPRPVSKELPVWVTTAGNPETWREAGAIGANVLTHLLGQSIEEVAGKIRIYHGALCEAGHDPADFKVTLMLHSFLAETREEARRIAREPMKDYLRAAAGLIKQYAWAFPAFKKPIGVKNAFEMDLGMLSADELEAILDFAFERYFEDSGLFGTVGDALLRVEELKRIGVDEIACLIDYGIAPDVVLEGLKPLAEVVRQSNAPQALAAEDFSLAAQIVRHGVTHLQCTPSMARMIAADRDAAACLGRLSHLLLGGEALPGDLAEALKKASGAAIHNMYGPTETTIWSTVETLAATPAGTAPIGRPVANTFAYVLDDAGNLLPAGAAGELCIGGAGVTAGYWQRPELTAERFPDDPFRGGRMYRTGDLARWDADGRLHYLGRSDHQVKIRGQRIELGEIEAALAACPGITGAVVVPRKVSGNERLAAYVTADAPVSEADLRQALAAQLPEAMVPSHVVTLERFPLTPNKKIDRKALPDPQPVPAAASGPAARPTGGAQARIATVWSRILGVSGIGAQDNFFALGGHSLLAVQAHRELRAELGAAHLSITDIFRFPTLAGLAAHIEGLAGAPANAEQRPTAAAEAASEPDRAGVMSKRRAMRASRRTRTA